MRYFLCILSIIIGAVPFVYSQERPITMDKASQTEKQILLVIREFGEAWARNDVATLESLLSDEYIHTDYLGKVQNKVEWLEYVRDRKVKGIVNKIDFADVKVHLYGDVAVVTGRNMIKGALTEEGKGTATQIRFTQVMLRKPNGWLRAAFQATPIAQQ